MAQAITPEQLSALENFQRHRDICKQWVRDITTFKRGVTSGNEDWARGRMISARIALHPNSQDYSEWIAQMTATLKGQVVWDGADAAITEANLGATVDFLNASGGAKYDEMANAIYNLRATREEF